MTYKSPTAEEQLAISTGNNNISTFLISLQYNLIAGLSIFLIFCFLRPKFPKTYSPRLYMLPKSKHFIDLPTGYFNWILPLLRTRHIDVLEHCGLDAYSILRFLRLYLCLFGAFSIMVPLVLVPIYVVNQRGLPGLESASISNLKDKPRIWGHAVMVSLISACFVFVLTREFRLFGGIRRDYLLKKRNQTILLTDLPKELRNTAALTLLFNSFPGGISCISGFGDAERVAKLVHQRQNIISQLEVFVLKTLFSVCKKQLQIKIDSYSIFSSTTHGQLCRSKILNWPRHLSSMIFHLNPQMCSFNSKVLHIDDVVFCEEGYQIWDETRLSSIFWHSGQENATPEPFKITDDATRHINHLCTTIQRLSGLIQREKDRLPLKDSCSVAFVTFSTLLGARLASESLYYHTPLTVTTNVHQANIVWENLHLHRYIRILRWALFKCFVAALIVFWAIPVTFISSLASLPTIASEIDFLHWIMDLPPFVLSFIQGVLPAILLSIMVHVLLRILLITTKWEGAYQYTDIQLSIMDKHFVFLLFNVLFVVTFANGIISSILPIINHPPSALDILAEQMPKVATFFIVFLSFQALVSSPLELLSPATSIVRYIKTRCWAYITPIGFISQGPAVLPIWGWVWPTHTLTVAITMAYSTLSPSIIFFAVLYFAAAYFVALYKVVCVYQPDPQCESGGLFFVKALKQSFVAIYIFQTIVFSVILLNKQIGPAVLILLTIVLTACAHRHCTWKHLHAIYNLPVHTVIHDTNLTSDPSTITYEKRETPCQVVEDQVALPLLPPIACDDSFASPFEHPSLSVPDIQPLWLPDLFPLKLSCEEVGFIRNLFLALKFYHIPVYIGKGFDLNVDTRELIVTLIHNKS